MKRKTNTSHWIRIAIPAVVILAWLGFGGVGGPYFGKVDEVSSNDISAFLPSDAESTRVKDELTKFLPSGTIPAIVVFESDSDSSITDAQKTEITNIKEAVQASGETKGNVSTPIYSDDAKAAFLLVPLDSNAEFKPVIDQLKSTIADAKPSLTYGLTGPAMFSRDLNTAFAGIDGTLLLVALGVVFAILLVVYRSPLLPIVTLMGAMMALATAILIVWHLAKAGILQLNGQVQGILFILVIGAATDYALLYISRYREELTHHVDAWMATKAAWKASWEPIVAAGGTVTLGLLCLLVSGLGSNKALGPVGGIGVALAVLSALTFLPAALLLLGRAAFWPKKPRFMPNKKQTDYHAAHPVWSKIGEFVGRYPRKLWIGIVFLLLIACLFVPQLKAEGVSQSDLILGKSEAREGQAILDKHFPSGSGSPVYVVVPETQREAVVQLLEKDQGVDTVVSVSPDSKGGVRPEGKSWQKFNDAFIETIRARLQADPMYTLAPAGLQDNIFRATLTNASPFKQPKVVDGRVLLQATLKDPASSLAARETVARLRRDVQPNYTQVQFGGVSAYQLDTNLASERDLRVIIPMILLAITIVLMLLLRSILAPLVLLLTTVLSFGTTLGTAALLFNHAWKYPGADPSVVIFGFVFLVALGIDYNIFLMTRIREETMKLGVRTGTLKALAVTGGVITSAGVVLASTFAALYVIPILFLAQIAFIVAFGVLLDTLIVRSLLVPSLTLEIGRRIWWPSKLSMKGK